MPMAGGGFGTLSSEIDQLNLCFFPLHRAHSKNDKFEAIRIFSESQNATLLRSPLPLYRVLFGR